MDAAARSNIILSSLFPANVRSRLFEKEHQKSELVELTTQSPITAVETKEQSQGERLKMPAGKGDRRVSMSMLAASMIPNAVNSAVSSVLQIPKLTLRTFLFDGLDEMETEVDNEELGYKGKPIADLFTDTTVRNRVYVVCYCRMLARQMLMLTDSLFDHFLKDHVQ
jgi:hypothetical protein